MLEPELAKYNKDSLEFQIFQKKTFTKFKTLFLILQNITAFFFKFNQY